MPDIKSATSELGQDLGSTDLKFQNGLGITNFNWDKKSKFVFPSPHEILKFALPGGLSKLTHYSFFVDFLKIFNRF